MTSFRPRNLAESLSALWNRRLLIATVAVAVLLSALVTIARVPDLYESRAVVVVANPDESDAVGAGEIAAISEQVTSRASLAPLIERYDLYRPVREHAGMDAAVEQMRKAIAIETKLRRDYPEAIAIAFKHDEPQIARGVLSELVASFEAANAAIRERILLEASTIGDQIATINGQLDQLDEVRTTAAARTAAAQKAYEEMQAVSQQRAAAASTIESLESRRIALTRQISEVGHQVEEQQKIVASVPATETRSEAAGPLLVKRAELKAQLAQYEGQYTDKNPKVIEARAQLAEVDRQIDALGESGAAKAAPLVSPAAIEMRSLTRELRRLETELEITERELARRGNAMPQMPVEPAFAANVAPLPASADGGYDRLRIQYQALMNRQDALSRAVPTALSSLQVFRVVDPPATPDTPVGPSRLLLAGFALALALGAGLFAAIVVESRRLFVINDQRDVSYFLGAPVLAAIPETLTPAEASRRRTTKLLRGAGFAVLAAAAVPALVALFGALHLFELLAQR